MGCVLPAGREKRLMLPAVLPLALTAACQTMGSGAIDASANPSTTIEDSACAAFRPIEWSKDDTLDTQRQATAHNAAWKRICGDKP